MSNLRNNKLATGLDTILERMGENEKQLKLLEAEHESLLQTASVEIEKNVDEEFILKGIKKLRSERFRKANLANKRDITRSVIKSIHINPDNVIRVDFWGSDDQSEPLREASRKQKGVVLPFHKLGRPLAASFKMGASSGEKYSEIKKAVGLGTYVLDSNGFFNLNSEKNLISTSGSLTNRGSCSIRSGGNCRLDAISNDLQWYKVPISHTSFRITINYDRSS